jgi:hypothetical protein
MMRANHIEAVWDGHKKEWHIRIQAGAEVVKRSPKHGPAGQASDDELRALALQIAADEGFEADPAAVKVVR